MFSLYSCSLVFTDITVWADLCSCYLNPLGLHWSHLINSFTVVYFFYFSSRQLLFYRISLTSLILEEWSNLAAIDW